MSSSHEYAKQIYADMKPADRVLLFMLKVQELSDLREVMITCKDDMRLVKGLMEMLEKDIKEENQNG